MKQYLRELPAIHTLQNNEQVLSISEEHQISSYKVTEWLQEEIDQVRDALLNQTWKEEQVSKQVFMKHILQRVEQRAIDFHKYYLKRVINATGTILHTNLGRARLSEQAINQVVQVAKNYSNLEYNIENGVRGSRHDIIESILMEVTGAEAAMVVNNNAAAVYLILRGLAKGKEVIVSRGELVEIGGSFRVSSIMEESEAKLIEVGTTNKTHLFDYERAISEETSLLMKVHTSNFKTIGFTASVSTEELTALSAQHDHVLVYEDLGSGALYDFQHHGIGEEPVVAKVLSTGVDIVSFSGDKLLGGPQTGIICGKKELIDKLKKHQLARVLRVDKMTLAALEATIKLYIQGNHETIPTVRELLLPLSIIKERADQFICKLRENNQGWMFEVRKDHSQVGGGTMPGVEIPTFVVAIKHPDFHSQQLFDLLRLGEPAIVARLKDDRILIDFRTVTEEEMTMMIKRFQEIITEN